MKTSPSPEQNQRIPGFECPVCRGFIPVSSFELLTKPVITCPNPQCSLELTIDRHQSQKAMDLLDQVNEAQKNLEDASSFKA